MSEILVELDDVSMRYSEGPAVLDSITFQVARGDSVGVVGPSGSGKSTLLNILGGLRPPSAGRVLLDGRDLARLSGDELAAVRALQVGFVFQAHHLLPQLSALENVLVPTLSRAARDARAGAADRARELLGRVGLGERVEHRPAQLSGGERQRVAVVRALINEPALLLADEPTGSLDGRSAGELGELLAELNRERGIALVVVTHSERLAGRMGRVLELRDGRLASDGDAA